jgi:hypothetical protein
MFTAAFWLATAERAVKTFAQVLGAVLLAAQTGILDTDWSTSFSVAGMAAVLSVLTSVASTATGEGPSLGTEELPTTEVVDEAY